MFEQESGVGTRCSKAGRMNTAQRQYQNQMPKFWRPKLTPTQQIDCKVIHWDLISRFSDGSAKSTDLWDWLETGFTYMEIMRLQALDGTEFTPEAHQAMEAQADIYEPVVTRFKRTGRVGFTGPELIVARTAAEVMDGLIDIDRNGISVMAAGISTAKMDRIRAMGRMAA
jgi:hypothetical protein